MNKHMEQTMHEMARVVVGKHYMYSLDEAFSLGFTAAAEIYEAKLEKTNKLLDKCKNAMEMHLGLTQIPYDDQEHIMSVICREIRKELE